MKKKRLFIKKTIIAKLDAKNLNDIKGGIRETQPDHFPCNVTALC